MSVAAKVSVSELQMRKGMTHPSEGLCQHGDNAVVGQEEVVL